MKITTEIQRNAKLLLKLNKKVICLTLTDKKTITSVKQESNLFNANR